MVLGVMPPVHVQGPVCPDHVAASAWLPVSWLCRFGCPPVQWCPVGRSPPCVGSIPQYTWDGLTLNLFCSIIFIVKVTHKQQHRFIFQQTLSTGNYSNSLNSTWFEHVRNPSATINRTINLNNHPYV